MMRGAQGECAACAWKEGRGGWGRKICEGQQQGWDQAVSAALTRVVKARMQRPEDGGSTQPVGGHGLVGHQCGRDEWCARELAGSKSGRADKCKRTC